MKKIILPLFIVVLSSCCSKTINQLQNPITEKELLILSKNCDYVFEKCKNRNSDLEIIELLKHTQCFNGLLTKELIAILGEPTKFYPPSEIFPFMIYELGKNERSADYFQAKYFCRNDSIISSGI